MKDTLFVVIVENDESEWKDKTGSIYHYPKRYQKYLPEGTQAVYYKGKLRNKKYRSTRLSDEPHYFGIATIGKSFPDKNSEKADLFALIENFSPFKEPILSKTGNKYIEEIPPTRATNYWRDGVRPISKQVYENLISIASAGEPIKHKNVLQPFNDREARLTSKKEGDSKLVFTTRYERSKVLRDQAIAIHGTTCIACGFNFENFYSDYGAGYIQIHHVNPISEFDSARLVNPELELVPLCANCHAVVHRRKDKTLSINELKSLINKKTD